MGVRGNAVLALNWARAWALAQPRPVHFLLNLGAQAHPNPSISSLPARGGRASGRLSSKKGKRMRQRI